jgi:hypothetical protein
MLPFGLRPGQPFVWFHRNPAKTNQYCLYCGAAVGAQPDAVPSTKEHLIGRRFVPPGTLDGDSFNFIFRACNVCNQRKSTAERHLSTVSLVSSSARERDPTVDELAGHKSIRDYHPAQKGVTVRDSAPQFEIRGRMGPATMTFSLVGPPQTRPGRAQGAGRHARSGSLLFGLVF